MKPALLIERIAAEGVTLSVSEDGNLDIDGDQTVVDSWLETIRQNKSAILFELRGQRVMKMLEADHSRKYALLANDTTIDPVIVTVGIRGLAVFDLSIPLAHYDGMALIEVIEQHCESAQEEKAA
jgi:hypothetical protein